MVSVPLAYSERRHRLNPDEIMPVHDAALLRLQQLTEAREPETLDEAGSLYRIWYRIHNHVHNKPAYGPHETWDEIAAQLTYGTESTIRELSPKR